MMRNVLKRMKNLIFLFGHFLDNDHQTPRPPKKEPTLRFIEHTFQNILNENLNENDLNEIFFGYDSDDFKIFFFH